MRRRGFNPWSFGPIGLILWLSGGTVELQAQRSVRLEMDFTNGSQFSVAWQTQSVVPAPGLTIFPDYQALTSTDLTNWVPIGEKMAGTVGGTNRTFSIVPGVAVEGMAFFRIESRIELPGVSLIGENLGAADFSGGNLFGAQLFDANLRDANLRGADLSGADLRFAVLTNADLNGASLFAARIVSADLSFAVMTRADLSFANLDAARLFAANLRGADLRSCVLKDSDLSFASLHEAKLDTHTLMDAKWQTVWEIVNQGATNRNLQRTDLSFSDISEADLRQADLRFADLSGAFAALSDFSGAKLSGANLRFLDLRGAKFDTNTVVDAKTRLIWQIVNEGVAGGDLHGEDLSDGILAEGKLSSANRDRKSVV